MATEPFARFVALDFSAASSPTLGANSLWLAVAEPRGPIRTRNLATRSRLADVLEDLCRRPGRTLVVVDVALGWPAGFARAVGLPGRGATSTTRLLDELLVDTENNVNNRFDVANELNRRARAPLFWGHPAGRSYTNLAPTTTGRASRWPDALATHRLIERDVGGVIKSPFQLAGVGAVGGQSLVAQVFFHRLARRGVDLALWPFSQRESRVVVGEYFFSLAPWRGETGGVTDQRQVRATARWLRGEYSQGRDPLSADLFGAATAEQRRSILREEGWLVGWARREPRDLTTGSVTRQGHT